MIKKKHAILANNRKRYEENEEQYKTKRYECMKKWCEKNREQHNSRSLQYYHQNKDEISRKKKEEKWHCPQCNKTIERTSKARHIRRIHSTP